MMDSELPNDSDVNNSFLIVARAIERMAVYPSKSQITLINHIAKLIANEQSSEERQSKYKSVWYVKMSNLYQGAFQYRKKIYKVYGKTDDECYLKLKVLKAKILQNEKAK